MEKKKAPKIFYVILLIIPILFFVFLEVGLRLIQYGRSYELFEEIDSAPPGMLYVNPEISYKYFGQLENPVFSQSIGLRKKKPENGYRVFVFGGSSAQGFPYARNASFPSHLQRRLEHALPEKIVEVVNLGTSAINSHTLLDILPEVLQYSPDLILIYAGHNEYYGALGPASTRVGSYGFVRLLLHLREYRTFQLFQNILQSFKGSSEEGKNLMQDMIGQSSIPFEGEIYQNGISQFDKNISEFIQIVKGSNIPIVIGTISSNLKDHRPFDSLDKGPEGKNSNEYFAEGTRLFQEGEFKKAKEFFVKAKEYDGLRFRAPEKINDIIKQNTKTFDIPLVDVDSIFMANSSGQITGDSLMCDHLHPSREGYFLMAKAFSKTIENAGFLRAMDLDQWPSDSLLLEQFPYSKTDSLYDKKMLLSGIGQYPFVPIGSGNPYENEIASIDLPTEISSRDALDSLRSEYAVNALKNGDTARFIKEMEVMVSYLPLNETPYLRTINRLTNTKILPEAYPIFSHLLKRLSESRSKNKMLGLFHEVMQEYDSAISYFVKALVENEGKDQLRLNLGRCYGTKGDFARAIVELTRTIRSNPQLTEAYHLRGGAYFELKQYDKAKADMTMIIDLTDGTDALAYMIRGFAESAVNNPTAACIDWRNASDLGSKKATEILNQYCK